MRPFRSWLSGVQFIKQRLGLFQIERIEAFGEPLVVCTVEATRTFAVIGTRRSGGPRFALVLARRSYRCGQVMVGRRSDLAVSGDSYTTGGWKARPRGARQAARKVRHGPTRHAYSGLIFLRRLGPAASGLLMGWSGRAPAPPATNLARGSKHKGARHVPEPQQRSCRDRH
jgi:hypothetical protein